MFADRQKRVKPFNRLVVDKGKAILITSHEGP
jgi:hypothetical protein